MDCTSWHRKFRRKKKTIFCHHFAIDSNCVALNPLLSFFFRSGVSSNRCSCEFFSRLEKFASRINSVCGTTSEEKRNDHRAQWEFNNERAWTTNFEFKLPNKKLPAFNKRRRVTSIFSHFILFHLHRTFITHQTSHHSYERQL